MYNSRGAYMQRVHSGHCCYIIFVIYIVSTLITIISPPLSLPSSRPLSLPLFTRVSLPAEGWRLTADAFFNGEGWRKEGIRSYLSVGVSRRGET